MKSLPGNIFMSQAFDIVSRITERSGQLRLAEQKVAEAILEDLSTAASASIGELAQKAGVSIASVTRFAKPWDAGMCVNSSSCWRKRWRWGSGFSMASRRFLRDNRRNWST